ncbi:hypothetical protein M2298_000583 [Brevibacillus sp. 1238]|jgi:hypothetical protein|uniref:DUF2158 domain-containing protein n=1 Tax=Brevibacillus parabrevis TaxID=54914 RepID=A0A4Y3PJJ5_BREPA|nr:MULTISPECIES: hypothetical protein [Brevibacillus]MDH6348651.1 hypothetical protein [Brevibacillus sp. 1238]GEB33604.1 hypothetical protein BPA01_31840 [Brevibacillus parabrevis]
MGGRSPVIQVGDLVVFVKDGAKGVVISIEEERCQVLWEDDFVSWEQRECLLVAKKEQPEQRGR